ncbi:FkbM family methyltransferase [Shewanella sp. Scap07]|uniref:hypothetical protein n=1 Tax=Shewanella sp. Scap07 TaxID=2589987 RepID=UPI0015BE9DB6|nr:hypothetical protein [Shewanella sp. Scap07]QLE86088.1 FkbM family methyltransferase [Shewanella sp. Scap07]
MDKAKANDFYGRFREIVSDPLNLLIERCPNAGFVNGEYVYLHNGIKVPFKGPLSYYDDFSQILVINRGVHEPVEEYVFQQVMKVINVAKPTMLELGAYWGHYSLWMKQCHPNSSVYLVESDASNLAAGKNNFIANGQEGHFIEAFVGHGHFNVDDYLSSKTGPLTILHSDIQGYEVEMLKDASRSLREHLVDYIFLSTHSQQLHQESLSLLADYGYRIEVSSDFTHETTSFDGFIFASSPTVKAVFKYLNPLGRADIIHSDSCRLLESVVRIKQIHQ